jgi:hypothetical protein
VFRPESRTPVRTTRALVRAVVPCAAVSFSLISYRCRRCQVGPRSGGRDGEVDSRPARSSAREDRRYIHQPRVAAEPVVTGSGATVTSEPSGPVACDRSTIRARQLGAVRPVAVRPDLQDRSSDRCSGGHREPNETARPAWPAKCVRWTSADAATPGPCPRPCATRADAAARGCCPRECPRTEPLKAVSTAETPAPGKAERSWAISTDVALQCQMTRWRKRLTPGHRATMAGGTAAWPAEPPWSRPRKAASVAPRGCRAGKDLSPDCLS